MEDIKKKPLMQRLVREKIFERYIVLHKEERAGRVRAIFDERGTSLYDYKGRQGIYAEAFGRCFGTFFLYSSWMGEKYVFTETS